MFLGQVLMGTSYFFKISETKVYIWPFKTNDVKIKLIFSLKVFIKITFPWKKCCSMIIVLTWLNALTLITIIAASVIWTRFLPNVLKKSLFLQWIKFFKIKTLLSLRETTPCHWYWGSSSYFVIIYMNLCGWKTIV